MLKTTSGSFDTEHYKNWHKSSFTRVHSNQQRIGATSTIHADWPVGKNRVFSICRWGRQQHRGQQHMGPIITVGGMLNNSYIVHHSHHWDEFFFLMVGGHQSGISTSSECCHPSASLAAQESEQVGNSRRVSLRLCIEKLQYSGSDRACERRPFSTVAK